MPELCLAVCEPLVDVVRAALPPEAALFVRVAPLPCGNRSAADAGEAVEALRTARADVVVEVLVAPLPVEPLQAPVCPRCAGWVASPDELQRRVVQQIAAWSLSQITAERTLAARQLAQYALAFEVLGQLHVLEGEQQIIDVITDLLRTLFAPGNISFTPAPAKPRLPSLTRGGTPVWESPLPWEETATGFRLLVEHDSTHYGVFELGDLREPAARSRYINLAVILSGVFGLAMANARALHGIITICSHCKKIREASGDWRPLEAYLTQHSGALFSHGICPTCVERFHRGDL